MSWDLIDENLPVSLAGTLGPGCNHATELGTPMSDMGPSTYARDHNLVLVTKDADDFGLLTLHGPPAKVAWVRTGNLRFAELHEIIARHGAAAEELLSGADLVVIHADQLEAVSFPSR